jgi:hypothetical protein
MPVFLIPPWSRGALAAVLFACAAGPARLQADTAARADDLEQAFRTPPASARPRVFWYWIEGAVSRAGITADLVAMQQAGLGGAYLMTIKGPAEPPLYTPAVRQLTPEWWALVKFAASEADRLGLKLGLSVSDGFATAGGPWITPELSMQKVVWSETIVEGGRPFAGTLPQPPTKENYYRDIAVLAFPTPAGSDPAPTPRITTSLAGFDAQFLAAGDGVKQLRTDAPCWIQYEYPTPFTLRSLVIRQWDKNFGGVYHATHLKLEASDDGLTFRPLGRLEPPRHGWQDWDADYTFSIAPVTARFFRFVHDPAGAEPGAEDLDGAKWKPRLVLRGLEFSPAARLPGFEGKSGGVWRRSAAATSDQLPDALCVPRDRIIDLTAKLGADGRLDWTPPPSPAGSGAASPPGRWTILRLGHTSTGHHNETGGAAQGLECDKFNPAAVRLQFDRWFGEAVRQLGPELAGRVLKVFHVDSWETGSQNWTSDFPAEFQRRRGYDPAPFLPAFAGIPVGSAADTERFLADVRQTISDLTAENFFGPLAELAHAHGCEFSAESTAPTMTGDGMRHFGTVDVPMGEFWLRSPTHDKPNDIQDAVSGAHIYGKNIVQAEAFTELRLQWDEHPGMLKALADHEFALGVNRFVFHVFAHNPWTDRRPGLTLSGLGLYFQRDQTWWPDADAWVDYISRCSALLQLGRPVADVAYFTGEDLPSRAILPEHRSPALPAGYAADSLNRDALLRLASVKAGRLVLPGGASYAAIVMPDGPRSPALEQKWRELQAAGVILTGHDLAAQLTARGVGPDLLTASAGIEWTHRASGDTDLYFVSNQQAEAQTVEVSLRGVGRQPEIWQPVTGEMRTAPGAREENGRTVVPLSLDPHGALFVVLRHPADGGRAGLRPALLQSKTGAPPLTLDGPWQVTFDPALGGPREPVTFSALTDWTAQTVPGIRYYSGPAVYARSIQWDGGPGRVWLDLGAVNNLARVTVNGINCGVAWTPPYRVDISRALRPGINRLEIRVTNTWANRLLGDRLAPPANGPLTWTTAPLREAARLLPAGLLGPVRILLKE